MQKEFTKWQGCGNDFVFFLDMEEKMTDLPELAVRLCDRHFGIGADGIILVLPPKDKDAADFRMRIINCDGSEAEMCGNGIRLFARLVYEAGLTEKTGFKVETGAGIVIPRLNFADGAIVSVTVDMGEPKLNAPLIPALGYGEGEIVAQPIRVGGRDYQMTCVSMGNPHAVVFRGSEAAVDEIAAVGAEFESHPAFPKKTNTEFCYVRNRGEIRMRVYERGAAMTLACGTGSCATLVAAVLEGRSERKAAVVIDGGRLDLEWRESDNHVYMTGPAERVFAGTIEL